MQERTPEEVYTAALVLYIRWFNNYENPVETITTQRRDGSEETIIDFI